MLVTIGILLIVAIFIFSGMKKNSSEKKIKFNLETEEKLNQIGNKVMPIPQEEGRIVNNNLEKWLHFPAICHLVKFTWENASKHNIHKRVVHRNIVVDDKKRHFVVDVHYIPPKNTRKCCTQIIMRTKS